MAWTVTDGHRGAPESARDEHNEDADGDEDRDGEDDACDGDDDTDREALSNV